MFAHICTTSLIVKDLGDIAAAVIGTAMPTTMTMFGGAVNITAMVVMKTALQVTINIEKIHIAAALTNA